MFISYDTNRRRVNYLNPLKEKILFDQQFGFPNNLVAGLDEAGRGAWMGPVVAACVILPEDFAVEGINDSKKINKEEKRSELAVLIKENAISYGVGFVHNDEIENIGIQQANFKAFQLALLEAKRKIIVEPSIILIDGNYKNIPIYNHTNIKKGDMLSASIACASILAKTSRDEFVSTICHEEYPDYEFNKHKGYGSKKHQDAIAKNGLTKWHRPYFCQKFLERINGGENIE